MSRRAHALHPLVRPVISDNRDAPRSGFAQRVLRRCDLVRGFAVDGEQRTAPLHAFILARFILRIRGSDDRANDSADKPSRADAGEAGNDRPGGVERLQAGDD